MKPIYRIMFAASLALLLVAVVLLGKYGLNLGVDFRGGSVLELEFTKGRPPIQEIADAFAQSGDEVVAAVSVAEEGTDRIVVRSADTTHNTHGGVTGVLLKKWPDAGMVERQFDFIGPAIGDELMSRSKWAILLVLIAISAYIALVFRGMRRVLSPWAMSVATLVALAHDVLLPVGLFAALGHWGGVEVNAVFVAAVLTIMGYSISDTVVVFDRVRENILRGVNVPFPELVHLSIMQTLARSIATNVTTLLSLVAIYLFGGEAIRYFALALIVGIFSGAYSSIFVAAPILVWMQRGKRR